MKKALLFTTVLILLCGSVVNAQFVNVTFRANVATIPDTMGSKGLVQIRGTTMTAAGQQKDDQTADTLSAGTILTWDAATTLYMENVDGDYWEGTFSIPAGTKLSYKFFTNPAHDTVYPGSDWQHRGWEAGLIDMTPDVYYGNRGLDLTNFTGSDTTLPQQFVNGLYTNPEQYFRPYTETDSIDIWFRVNIHGWEEFNEQNQILGVRGGLPGGADIGDLKWNKTLVLSQEKKHVNTGSSLYNGKYFWSGQVRIPSEEVTAGQQLDYKFVIMNVNEPLDGTPLKEEDETRSFAISPAKSDTTLYWQWFNNTAPLPVQHNDNVNMTFVVDMTEAIKNRGFSIGDTVEVRAGYFATASEVVTIDLKRQGFTTFYKGSGRVKTTLDQMLDYQYYVYKRGSDFRETYYNFYYDGEITGEAERRQALMTDTRVAVNDTITSQVDPRRMPFFQNTEVIAQDVLVTVTCDIRPAYYQVLVGSTLEDIQGEVNVTEPDSVMAWGVAINGPLTGAWSNPIGPDWGVHLMTLENKRMYDDGTHGDAVEGDSIFTIQFQLYKDSLDVIGQEFKFGIRGGDNEGGYGNNHIENVDDEFSEVTINAQFGSIDPLFYNVWDYDKRELNVAIEDDINIVSDYSLYHNYPNPFNPSTRIKYKLGNTEKVTLKIYNILGKHVITLVNEEQRPGPHFVNWDGQDKYGQFVGAGVYLFKITAGDFVKSHKMLLLK